MAGAIKIFVEGEADKKFISDYVSYLYGIDIYDNLIKLEGWECLADGVIINQFKKNTDNLGVNLIIIDADSDANKRKLEVEGIIAENEITASFFLLPNDSDEGDLETLLERIISTRNSQIFECWGNYEDCLSHISIEGRDAPLSIPARKSKIYSYLEALVGESRSQKKLAKDPNRNYKNADHWDLGSENLSDLKAYLDDYYN